jgi:amino acid transporter
LASGYGLTPEPAGRGDAKTGFICHVLFTAFFILLPNTDGNALQIAKHVLLAANPEAQNTEELDQRLITLLAILVLNVVCLLHYFSRNSGLLLNLLFAAYKIVIAVLIIAGGISYANSTEPPNDWNDQPVDNKDALAALIYIVYSYQGWENANYVRVVSSVQLLGL